MYGDGPAAGRGGRLLGYRGEQSEAHHGDERADVQRQEGRQ